MHKPFIFILLIFLIIHFSYREPFKWTKVTGNNCGERCMGHSSCIGFSNDKKVCYHLYNNKKKGIFYKPFTSADNVRCVQEKDKWILQTDFGCLEKKGGKVRQIRPGRCISGPTEKECWRTLEQIRKDQYWHTHPILLKQVSKKYPRPTILGKKYT